MTRDEQLLMANRLAEGTIHPVSEFLKYIEWWDDKGVPNIEYELRLCVKRRSSRTIRIDGVLVEADLWREFAEVDWNYKEPHMYNKYEMSKREWEISLRNYELRRLSENN